MNTNSVFRFSLAAIAAAALTACGGGGSDPAPSTATSTAPTPSSTPVTPVGPQAVVMTGISIKAGDVLAQTTSNATTVSFLGGLFERFTTKALFIDTAFASNGNDKVKPGNNFGFTNKIEGGKLVTLAVKLKGKDGKDSKCDTSTAEVKVHKIWGINPGKGHLMVQADAPTSLNADCTVDYKKSTFAVTAQGDAIELSVDGDDIVRVVEAGDEAANTSDKAVLVFRSGAIRTLTINEAGAAVLQTLTHQGLPLSFANPNTFAFNGTYLVGMSSERSDAVLVFNVNDASFKIISTTMAAPGTREIVPSGYGQAVGVFITHDGQFVWHEWGNYSRQLNVVAGNYIPWQPAQTTMVVTASGDPGLTAVQPNGRYGVRGRSGEWILSDRCLAWNYNTNAWRLGTDPTATDSWSAVVATAGTVYAKMEKGYAHCVNSQGNIFSRLKLNDLSSVVFDTDRLGFFFAAGRKFEMFQDKAMLWGAVSTSNGDIKVMELNFDTGSVTDHGIISVGDRKITTLVPVGG